jgi:hypothetical protein
MRLYLVEDQFNHGSKASCLLQWDISTTVTKLFNH